MERVRQYQVSGPVLIAHPSADLYGSDRVMLETIDAAVGSGRQVHVTLPGPGPLVAEIRARGAQVTFCGTPVLRKSMLRPRRVVALIGTTLHGAWQGGKLIRSLRPSVLYVSTLTIPLWSVLGRLLGVPVLAHVHESERQAPLALRRMLAAPLLLADRVLVNSEFSRSVLADSFRTLRRRSTVLYNGVPGPVTPTPARVAIDGPARLLFVGRLAPRKGPQVAIAAVEALTDRGRDVRLDLVGSVFPGYEWFEQQLADQIAGAALSNRVRLVGFRPDIWPELTGSDILLVPSQGDEPFGNTAVEAVLAGRPVIVSAGSGLDEAVDAVAASRRVPAADVGAWADAIEDMIENWPKNRTTVAVDAVAAGRRFAPAVYAARLVEQLDALEPLNRRKRN